MERKGISEIICDNEGNRVSIKYLLDGYEAEEKRNVNEFESIVVNISNIDNSTHTNVTVNVELSQYLSDLQELKKVFQNDFDRELFELLNDLCIEVDELKNTNLNKGLLDRVINNTSTLLSKISLTRVSNFLISIDKGIDFIEKIERYLKIFKNIL